MADEELPNIVGLLRMARQTYGRAMREALERADYDDVPANGLFVIGALARTDAPLSQIIGWLGASKQAAGQLVDTLVARGYLSREVDPTDRRRLTVGLTPRGEAAAAVIRGAADAIDAELEARVGPEHVAITLHTLSALVDIGWPEE